MAKTKPSKNIPAYTTLELFTNDFVFHYVAVTDAYELGILRRGNRMNYMQTSESADEQISNTLIYLHPALGASRCAGGHTHWPLIHASTQPNHDTLTLILLMLSRVFSV